MQSTKTFFLAVTCAAGIACTGSGCASVNPYGGYTSYNEAKQVLDSGTSTSTSGVKQVSFESEIGKKTAEKTLADAIDPSKNISRATKSVKNLAGQGFDEEKAKSHYAASIMRRCWR